eukprot:412447-Rhodomonas_salina.2
MAVSAYAMSGTDIAYHALCLRACSAMSSADPRCHVASSETSRLARRGYERRRSMTYWSKRWKARTVAKWATA